MLTWACYREWVEDESYSPPYSSHYNTVSVISIHMYVQLLSLDVIFFLGPRGIQGADGRAGAQGRSGAQGDTGPDGGPGPQGHDGPTGPIGLRGRNSLSK